MGNLCGKESSDNFATPGRTLASTPAQPKTATVPTNTSKIKSETRKLGGAGGQSDAMSTDAEDARRKAAAAAEARANTKKPTGKLSSQLEAQKKQTQNQTLAEASATERRLRDADATAEVRAHN